MLPTKPFVNCLLLTFPQSYLCLGELPASYAVTYSPLLTPPPMSAIHLPLTLLFLLILQAYEQYVLTEAFSDASA